MRLKAFTLVEMMAGLAIAALVVMLGFYAVQLLKKQYLLFEKTTDEALDYQRVEALLWHDFTEAQWVLLESDSLVRCEQERGVVEYGFSTTYLTRRILAASVDVDTFPVHFALQTASLDGTPVSKGLTDHCSFNIHPFGDKHFFSVQKLYSAAERINYQNKYEH
jgi:prepilin-type N-terminal cleavage/methylation domain-containing protein